MNNQKIENIKRAYAQLAKNSQACCCNGILTPQIISKLSQTIGYTSNQTSAFLQTSLSLGCGNPTAFANIKENETVIDLGCGTGFDCFLAAEKVNNTGRVIGVDITKEMIKRARENAVKNSIQNVDFILGKIECLSLPDDSVDWVMSNCVINLSQDKTQVFREAFRVLRQRGKMLISDIVLDKPLPKDIADSVQAYIGCVGGAELKDKYTSIVEMVGFRKVEIIETQRFNLKSILEDTSIQTAVQLFGFNVERLKIKIQEIESSIVGIKLAASKK